MRLYMQNFHLPSSVFSTRERLLSLLATLYWPTVEMQYGDVSVYGVKGNVMTLMCGRSFVNVVSYHVSNKRKARSNPVFCVKGSDVKVGNVCG